jgi:hypothetical protein
MDLDEYIEPTLEGKNSLHIIETYIGFEAVVHDVCDGD